MFDSSKIIFATIFIFVSAASIFSQRTLIFYDESNVRIKAIYNINNSIYDAGLCKKLEATIGVITEASEIEDTTPPDTYYAFALENNKETVVIPIFEIGVYPSHIQENLKEFLLSKGSKIKVWGCDKTRGSNEIFPLHIIKEDAGANLDFPPAAKDSFLQEDPSNAIKRLIELNKIIDSKVKQVKDNFDKEIAPNISKEKGEFETTAEFEIRLSKLQNLRTANSSKLWKNIYLETNSLANEYIKIVGSYYTLPLKLELGTYDADEEMFGFNLKGRLFSRIKVPRIIAPTFKKNFDKVNSFADFKIEFKQEQFTVEPRRIRIEYEGQTFTEQLGLSYKDFNHLPIITSRPSPAYTNEARKNGVYGTVVLNVEFLDTGKIGAIEVVKGLPFGLTEAAKKAAQNITFTPAQTAGVPYTVTKEIKYNFLQ